MPNASSCIMADKENEDISASNITGLYKFTIYCNSRDLMWQGEGSDLKIEVWLTWLDILGISSLVILEGPNCGFLLVSLLAQ